MKNPFRLLYYVMSFGGQVFIVPRRLPWPPLWTKFSTCWGWYDDEADARARAERVRQEKVLRSAGLTENP